MKKIILTFAFTLGCLTAVSAQAPGFDDDVEDVAAPIPGIALAVAAAVGIGVAK